MSKIISTLSKIWLNVKNIENSLFSKLQEQLGVLSPKEQKLIKILDFAEIEKNICTTSKTNPPKDREPIARAFIDRLHIDKTLRILCGWRHSNNIPSESKFLVEHLKSLVN